MQYQPKHPALRRLFTVAQLLLEAKARQKSTSATDSPKTTKKGGKHHDKQA
jgi:hypothetical protein